MLLTPLPIGLMLGFGAVSRSAVPATLCRSCRSLLAIGNWAKRREQLLGFADGSPIR